VIADVAEEATISPEVDARGKREGRAVGQRCPAGEEHGLRGD